jgi:membrane protease YdiL (CAAX protease family)
MLRDTGVAVVFLVARYVLLVFLRILMRPGHSPGVQRLLPHSRSELIVFMAVSATAGIVEEIIFRGYLQRQFAALRMGGWTAVTLQAVIFGLAHGYQGSSHMFLIGIFGLLFGGLAKQRVSLRPGMLAHVANDALGGIITVFLKHSH